MYLFIESWGNIYSARCIFLFWKPVPLIFFSQRHLDWLALLKIFSPSVDLNFILSGSSCCLSKYDSFFFIGLKSFQKYAEFWRYYTSPFDVFPFLVVILLMHVTPFVPTTLTYLQRHAGRLHRFIFPLKIFQRHVSYFPESCRKMHLAMASLHSKKSVVNSPKFWTWWIR